MVFARQVIRFTKCGRMPSAAARCGLVNFGLAAGEFSANQVAPMGELAIA